MTMSHQVDQRSQLLNSTADRVQWLVMLCVPLPSIVGGIVFAVAAMNVSAGDSTLMIGSLIGAAVGLAAAIPVWIVRRATLRNAPSLRYLRTGDIFQALLAVVVMSPFAMIAGFLMLPVGTCIFSPIEAIAGEAVAVVFATGISTTLFYVVILSGMQAAIEWRLLARLLDRG
jgi:hypothetical protein